MRNNLLKEYPQNLKEHTIVNHLNATDYFLDDDERIEAIDSALSTVHKSEMMGQSYPVKVSSSEADREREGHRMLLRYLMFILTAFNAYDLLRTDVEGCRGLTTWSLCLSMTFLIVDVAKAFYKDSYLLNHYDLWYSILKWLAAMAVMFYQNREYPRDFYADKLMSW